MNEKNNITIYLGKEYGTIFAKRIIEVTNDADTYILISTENRPNYKIYMTTDEMDSMSKNIKKNEIDLRNFIDRTYILKDRSEFLITRGLKL